MADQIDIAHERIEQQLAESLSQRVRYKGKSARRCADCGEPIPDVRRRSVPGVQTCVICQEVRERAARERR
ncbi:conjugal transfer protein TraR [Sulfurifustis variabilis]|uniref:Conjugal transfer protein TraR n=1 Tax=Sulfurifustis variabilis TaxID=1675686 RepID=A0A1B4V1T7_9GAMM|nr:TraR/DksA C4-type zinc finger protein [Sulfurifustis variabilis]BAU47413.1 conjugal transfer protein TraR [Sulfurifustis variabilis]